MSLNLLLDSADQNEWNRWMPSGIFNGITTNPTLLKKVNSPCNHTYIKELAIKAADLGCKELHLQAWGKSDSELTDCGLQLSELGTNKMKIFVKLPITKVGSFAAKSLIESNIPITFTACYEIKQVLIADAIGANYLAPYLGRINELGKDGEAEIINMQKSLEGIESKCKLLIASIRDTKTISLLTSYGINTFTISPLLAEELLTSQETANAARRFEEDSNAD